MGNLNANVTAHNLKTGASQTFPAGTKKSDIPDGFDLDDAHFVDPAEQEEVATPGPGQVVGEMSAAEAESTYGSGSFKSRSATQVKALAEAHGLAHDNKDEAIAALEAEGVNPDDAPPAAPTSTDTNVEG